MRNLPLRRLATFAVWTLAAASAAAWAMTLFARPQPLPPSTATVASAQPLRGDLVRLFGEPPADDEPADEDPAFAEASRFQLLGVVAPRAAGAASEGVALIAIDGKPARAFRVGAVVDGELVLRSVRARGAELGTRGAAQAALALDLPQLPAPATGVPGGARAPAPGIQPGVVRPGLPMPPIPRPGQAPRPAPAPPTADDGDDGGDDEPPPQPPGRSMPQTQTQ